MIGAGEGNRTLVCSLGNRRAARDFNRLAPAILRLFSDFACRFETIPVVLPHPVRRAVKMRLTSASLRKRPRCYSAADRCEGPKRNPAPLRRATSSRDTRNGSLTEVFVPVRPSFMVPRIHYFIAT